MKKNTAKINQNNNSNNQKKSLFWSMVIIGIFMVAEFIGGIWSGSLALLADSGHMLSDFVALMFSWLAQHYADKPADKMRSYGYGRLQIISTFCNSIMLFMIAAMVSVEALHRFISPDSEIKYDIMFIVAVMGLLANIGVFIVLNRNKNKSLNIRSAILHVIGDILGSVAAIVAAIIIYYTGMVVFDPILSVVVTLIILYTAWCLLRDSSHILLEGAPPHVNEDNITKVLVGEFGIIDVHHVHMWSLYENYNLATLHMVIRQDSDVPKVLLAAKKKLSKQLKVKHATIEVEFEGVECSDDGKHLHL